MADCVNFREELVTDDDGNPIYDEQGNQVKQFVDSLNIDVVAPEHLISFHRQGQKFCYDVIALLQSHQARNDRREFRLPENREVLTPDEVRQVYQKARGLYSSIYMVAFGDVIQPFVANDEATANEYVNRHHKGTVFRVAQTNDPALHDLLYPNGLNDVIPGFGIRGIRPMPAFGDEVVEHFPLVRPDAQGFETPVDESLSLFARRQRRDERVRSLPRHTTPNGDIYLENIEGDYLCYDTETLEEVPCPQTLQEPLIIPGTTSSMGYRARRNRRAGMSDENNERETQALLSGDYSNLPPPPRHQERDIGDIIRESWRERAELEDPEIYDPSTDWFQARSENGQTYRVRRARGGMDFFCLDQQGRRLQECPDDVNMLISQELRRENGPRIPLAPSDEDDEPSNWMEVVSMNGQTYRIRRTPGGIICLDEQGNRQEQCPEDVLEMILQPMIPQTPPRLERQNGGPRVPQAPRTTRTIRNAVTPSTTHQQYYSNDLDRFFYYQGGRCVDAQSGLLHDCPDDVIRQI